MKWLFNAGKVLTLLFWGLIISHLVEPAAQPFTLVLMLAGGLVMVLHLLQILLYRKHLSALNRPLLGYMQSLLWGGFYLLALPSADASKAVEGSSTALIS